MTPSPTYLHRTTASHQLSTLAQYGRYMARHYETRLDKQGRVLVPTHAERPRGTVVKVV